MGLLFEKGTWTGSGSSPQTITLADSSLTPMAILCWTTGPGSAGSFSANAIFSKGFSTRRGGSTQSGCVGIISIDNVATGDTARVRNTTLLHVLSSTSATDYTVSLSSFGAGQFVVTYSSAANASGDIFHYCVWGGDDVTDATVVNQTMSSVGATQGITGVGFRPTVVFALDSDLATTATITAGLGYSFGMASSATLFSSFALTATDADTTTGAMNWNCALRADACLERLLTNADTSDARWDLDSFDGDGATLGVVDAPGSTDRIAEFLFIQGGQWEVGNKAKATTAISDTFTLANTILTPKGLVLFNTRQTAVGVTTGRADFCVGASDGIHEGIAGITNPETVNTTSDRFHATDRVIEELTGGAPAETSEATSITASATDDFNRANNNDVGASWNVQTGHSRFGVASNAVTPGSLGGDSAENYSGVTLGSNQRADSKVTVSGTGSTGGGSMVRASAAANTLYRAVANKAASNNVNVVKFVAAVFTSLAQRTAAWVDGDTIRLDARETTLQVSQNLTQLGADITDASIAAGRSGVAYSSTATSCSLDDFATSDYTGFRQGEFELNWLINGGSAALVSYLAFGDAQLPFDGAMGRVALAQP